MRVIITGASKGIGYALANEFAAHGHDLILTSRTASHLSNAAITLAQQYPTISIATHVADLSNFVACQDFATFALTLGAPDILINNAGQYIGGTLLDEPENVLEDQLNTNLFSAYHLTRALVPAMLSNKRGHIFNIGSIAGLAAYANGGAYSISKFALHGFSQNLRLELKDKGVKVTLVVPGAVMTNSWAGSGVDPHRIMEAADIAKMIYAASQLSPQAVVEDIVMRPLLGDL